MQLGCPSVAKIENCNSLSGSFVQTLHHVGLPWAGEPQAELPGRAERWQMPAERGGKKELKHRGRDEATASRCLGLKSRSPISARGGGI